MKFEHMDFDLEILWLKKLQNQNQLTQNHSFLP